MERVMEDSMGNLVNLRQFRKQAAREQAAANRVRFGRTKSERTAAAHSASRTNDFLDQHRIDGGDAS
jgi:hypothetical protein